MCWGVTPSIFATSATFRASLRFSSISISLIAIKLLKNLVGRQKYLRFNPQSSSCLKRHEHKKCQPICERSVAECLWELPDVRGTEQWNISKIQRRANTCRTARHKLSLSNATRLIVLDTYMVRCVPQYLN